MELGMIGSGRMGGNMVRRLLRAGHACVVYDIHPEAVQSLVKEGATGATSLEDFVGQAEHASRGIWMMVPAAAVDPTLAPSSRSSNATMRSSTAATPTTTTISAALPN